MKLRVAKRIISRPNWRNLKKRTVVAAFVRINRRLRRNIRLDHDKARDPAIWRM